MLSQLSAAQYLFFFFFFFFYGNIVSFLISRETVEIHLQFKNWSFQVFF